MRQAKWGPGGGGEDACAIEVQDPISGNASLPQKPFSSLLYLQRHWYEEDPRFRNLPILAGLGKSAKRGKPEGAKQALAEADLAAAERAQASGDTGMVEAAVKAAASAAGAAGAAAAAGSAAASDPAGAAAKDASKDRAASAELDTLKPAGKAGEASDASDGIDAAAAATAAEEDEEVDAAVDLDEFEALDEEDLDYFPEEADEENALLAELDDPEAVSGDGEEALGGLEGFEATSGNEKALADLKIVEAEQAATEWEGLRKDADAEVGLSDPARERLPLSFTLRSIPAGQHVPHVQHVEAESTCSHLDPSPAHKQLFSALQRYSLSSEGIHCLAFRAHGCMGQHQRQILLTWMCICRPASH